MKKIIVALCAILFTTTLMSADLGALSKDVYAKAKGNKTESQWNRYFKSPKWQKKLAIDGLSAGDRSALLEYLNARSADKDQATVPQ